MDDIYLLINELIYILQLKLEKQMASLLQKIQAQQKNVNAERRTIRGWLVGMSLMCKVNQTQISCKLGHSQLEDQTWEMTLGNLFLLILSS